MQPKHLLFVGLSLILFIKNTFTQNTNLDSLSSVHLDELVISSRPLINHTKQSKPLSTIDEYLNKQLNLTLIRRGNYAWEPMLNNMTNERLQVTIDGMHIFGACTDKMDPITSYVDVSNISDIQVHSGQDGTTYGPTIGGSIDMVRKKHDFCFPGWSGSVNLGYESNGNLFTTAGRMKYAHSKFFADIDFTYRDAGNYKAGKRTLVPYSQYTKYNASATLGVKLNAKNELRGSFIFDDAEHVGYPALPMDVAFARAYIASLEHSVENVNPFIEEWVSRVYFNTIQHQMDDTKRPEVPIHMDMPGWSTTYGFYSKIKASRKKHALSFNVNAYLNKAIAEMTMYPKDTTEKSMFMYTWPNVQALYVGLNVAEKYAINVHHSINIAASVGIHRNHIGNQIGLQSLQILYPNLNANKNRSIISTHVGYTFTKNNWEFKPTIGYGERAPSISEGYGFYLFNSSDGYDYIGNPTLKNEKSIEVNTAISYKTSKVKWNLKFNYFHILDYIVGVPMPEYIAMTIGAKGIKVYQSLKSVNIINTECSVQYQPITSLKINMALSYNFGRDYLKQALPLIRPFTFRGGISYHIKGLEMEVDLESSTKQYAIGKVYGENPTKAYAIVNCAAGYVLPVQQHSIFFKLGVENIADTYYATFSDWNKIPQKGRNFYLNIAFIFNSKTKTN